MSEQANKALVLANRLSAFSRDCCNDMHSAAAELRRLHSVNAEILEALQVLRSRLIECARNDAISARDAYDSFYQEMVDSAISSALGQSKGE